MSNLLDPLFGIYAPAIINVSQSTDIFAKLFYCAWWGQQNLRLALNITAAHTYLDLS
jgi:hypothetical protein